MDPNNRDLFRNRSVVERPINTSVDVGMVKVAPLLLIEVIIGFSRVLLLKVCTVVKLASISDDGGKVITLVPRVSVEVELGRIKLVVEAFKR